MGRVEQPAVVQRCVSVLDEASIVKSFLMTAELHRLHMYGRTTHAWHCVFLLTVSAATQSQSSSCERIGSLLHAQDDGSTSRHAVRIANRLQFACAGVQAVGGTRDEWIVNELASTMLDGGKRPLLRPDARSKRRRLGQEISGPAVIPAMVSASNARAELAGCCVPELENDVAAAETMTGASIRRLCLGIDND